MTCVSVSRETFNLNLFWNCELWTVIYDAEPTEDVEPPQASDSPPSSPEPAKTNTPEVETQPVPEPEAQGANSETKQTEAITQQPQKTEQDGQSTNAGKDPGKVEKEHFPH